MKSTEDPIATLAFAEIFISCQMDKCPEIFWPSVEEHATDPVDEWASRMTTRARAAGWMSSSDGLVLCPIHGKRHDAESSLKL